MKKRKTCHIGTHLFLLLCALITVSPFIWMLLTSLKTYDESIRIPLVWFPKKLQWENYAVVWEKFPIL